jgi:hypothetical protein
MTGFVHDATVEMHPHPTNERSFFCYCSKWHRWGERGTRTFRIPVEKHAALGYQMIECKCSIWHVKAIPRQDAENTILEGEK